MRGLLGGIHHLPVGVLGVDAKGGQLHKVMALHRVVVDDEGAIFGVGVVADDQDLHSGQEVHGTEVVVIVFVPEIRHHVTQVGLLERSGDTTQLIHEVETALREQTRDIVADNQLDLTLQLKPRPTARKRIDVVPSQASTLGTQKPPTDEPISYFATNFKR